MAKIKLRGLWYPITVSQLKTKNPPPDPPLKTTVECKNSSGSLDTFIKFIKFLDTFIKFLASLGPPVPLFGGL